MVRITIGSGGAPHLFAPDPITVTVETKYVRPNYPNATRVFRAVTGPTHTVVIAGVRVETRTLV